MLKFLIKNEWKIHSFIKTTKITSNRDSTVNMNKQSKNVQQRIMFARKTQSLVSPIIKRMN